MRLLILDDSLIVASLVRRLLPDDVEIQEAETFAEAMASLKKRPPDAVIADLGMGVLPWREFIAFCQSHQPRIPVLFESAVHRTREEAGIGQSSDGAFFLAKPYHLADLRIQISRLLAEAGRRSGGR